MTVGDVTLSPGMIPFVLSPGARGRGFGTMVIRRLISRAVELGWSQVKVSDIYEFNHASRALFEGLGFESVEATRHGRSYVLRLDASERQRPSTGRR